MSRKVLKFKICSSLAAGLFKSIFELLPAKVADLTDKSSEFAFPDPTSCETSCFTGKELQETPKIWLFC